MGVKLSSLNDRGIFKIRIYPVKAFDNIDEVDESDKQFTADLEEYKESIKDLYIDVRELTEAEAMSSQGLSEGQQTQRLAGLLEKCIVGHNVETDNGEEASISDVYAWLTRGLSVWKYVLTTWANSLPLARMKPDRPDTLPSA